MAEVIKVTFDDHKEEVARAAREQIYGWLKAVGEDAAKTAADKAPYDTGNLRNSTRGSKGAGVCVSCAGVCGAGAVPRKNIRRNDIPRRGV